MNTPRPEYPRPQFEREKWLNLNGTWKFEIDAGCSGEERALFDSPDFGSEITVPFCPESRLSGLAHTDFIPACWYSREVDIPEEWLGGGLLLHFGAVNYECKVWVNGKLAGRHAGGYVSFAFDIAELAHPGKNTIVVGAKSDVRGGVQPSGKQSPRLNGFGCFYTRTTGIWQTVWLEPVPATYLQKILLTPDVANTGVHIRAALPVNAKPASIKAEAFFDGKPVGSAEFATFGASAQGFVKLSEEHLWNVGEPNLYDLKLTLTSADGTDSIASYFGLRLVEINGRSVCINGKPVYQRLVLDQGFNPEGIITAPTDDELRADIERSLAMGFNGARLHQKIFEPRFIYWADKLGYIIWGEHGNWGLKINNGNGLLHFMSEWTEAVERDYSSPALVGWCPFNETQPDTEPKVLETVYRVTKALDSTRPVIDTSGWVHCEYTDIYDYHDYDQNPESFQKSATLYASAEKGKPFPQREQSFFRRRPETTSHGQPIFISEFGGIGWRVNAERLPGNAWGYGQNPQTEAEYLERLEKLMGVCLNTPGIMGFCYTQLTDVEQEINGLYTYERAPKFPPEVIKPLICRPAWNEK